MDCQKPKILANCTKIVKFETATNQFRGFIQRNTK